MTAIARTPPTFISRSRLQLAGALAAGIAIGSVAGAQLTDEQPAGAGSVTQAAPAVQAPAVAAPDQATTSASEQYQSWYTRPAEHRASTTAGEQYRAWYTAEE
jgi:hypothetical protein